MRDGKRATPFRASLLACLALALLVAGCGAEEHANDPRPPVPTEVTASISQRSVSVQPSAVGVDSAGQQSLSQNAGQKEPEINSNTPLTVAFTIANLTDFPTQLQIQGPVDKKSPKLVPQGTSSFKADLPTGDYLITAADIPGASAARFRVGPARTSSENDLLLP
jgi:hypothetical protein